MRKIISASVLIVLCFFISQIAFSQNGNLNRPKDVNAIANKPVRVLSIKTWLLKPSQRLWLQQRK
jgi:hypothetical protein